MLEKALDLLRRVTAIDRRLLIFGTAGLVGLLALGVIGLTTLSQTNYSLLYGELTNEDSRQIIRVLDRNGSDFDTRNLGAEILVPTEDVNEIRILLAKEGLPSKGTLGYELFDDQSAIGTSNLVQEVNRLRATEGELSRTINSMQGIESSRVHIVLPRRELFSRESQEPSASIVIKTQGGTSLDGGQVQSILHIVSAAVPNLNSDAVTLVDDRGELLASGGGDASGNIGGRTPDQVRIDYETRIARRLEAILENVVGRDRVRAEVRVEMDFSQTVINDEDYDPDSQIARSTENIEENSSRSAVPERAVTVQNNIPENQLVTQGQINENEQSSRTEERINYEISKTETNQIIPPGRLDKVSVAVLVDGVYLRTGVNDLEYQPRTSEEMQQIERLVKSAIGFDTINRKDQVEIVNLQFSTSNIIGTAEEPLIYGLPATDFRDIVEQVVLAIVILLILFWVVRPLVVRLIGNAGEDVVTRIGADGKPMLVYRKTGEAVKALPGSVTGVGAAGQLTDGSGADGKGENGEEEYTQLANLQSQIKSNIVKKLNAVVTQYPNESTALLREWLSQK